MGWPSPVPMVRSHERTLLELEELTPGRRLLDIGAGRGDLLAAASLRSWTVTGIEPNYQAVAESRAVFGLKLMAVEWRRGLVRPASFDAVVLNHVIEHLPQPREALEAAREALAPGGVIFLAAPNWRSLDMLVSRRTRAAIFDAPRHRYVFSDRSLAVLVRRSGFIVISCAPQLSRLLRPIVRNRFSSLEALNAVATRDAGDVLRDDPYRVSLAGREGRDPASRRVAVISRAIRLCRVVVPGAEVRIYARKE